MEYYIRVIGTEDYFEKFAPCLVEKHEASKYTKEECDKMIARNTRSNRGTPKIEAIEAE